jgi:hypothetical protein
MTQHRLKYISDSKAIGFSACFPMQDGSSSEGHFLCKIIYLVKPEVFGINIFG